MKNQDNHQLDETLKCMGWMDLIWAIPSAFLFAYLPNDYIWQFFVNLFIVIFTAIGFSVSLHHIYSHFKQRQQK